LDTRRAQVEQLATSMEAVHTRVEKAKLETDKLRKDIAAVGARPAVACWLVAPACALG
jgi:hypothetical protein